MSHSPEPPNPEPPNPESPNPESPKDELPTDDEVLVDARGTRCPMPVILAARAAQDLPAGTTLRVLATDPAAAADLPAWCRMRGHTLFDLVAEPGSVDCRVRLA